MPVDYHTHPRAWLRPVAQPIKFKTMTRWVLSTSLFSETSVLRTLAGGRALIPKNVFGCPILAGLFSARVGSFSCLVETLVLSPSLSVNPLLRARRSDDAVNLARRKGCGALAPGFLSYDSQNRRLVTKLCAPQSDLRIPYVSILRGPAAFCNQFVKFLISIFYLGSEGRSLPEARASRARRRPANSAAFKWPSR
jgi:hypothetical protein